MTENRSTKKILRNVLYGFSTWVLPLSLSFVVTPVLVKTLGNIQYGIYALIIGFIAYSFNFNIGRAATKFIADYVASEKQHEIGKIVSSTFILNIAIGLVGCLAIFICAHWLVIGVFNIEPSLQTISVKALRISAAIIFFMMLSQVFTSVIQGFHRFDIFAIIQNFNSLGGMLGNLFLALNGYGLIELLYWNLTIVSISCALSLVSCIRLLNKIPVLSFSSKSLKLVTGYSIGVVGYQIAANALLLFERGWITSKFGSDELTYYVVPMTLAILLHSFVVSLTMIVFPTASEVSSNKEKLLKLYLVANKFVIFIVFYPSLFLIFWSSKVLTAWIGNDFGTQSSTFLILHVITFASAAFFVVAFQVAEGLGNTKYNFITMLAGTLFAIPLMIIGGVNDNITLIAVVRTITFFGMLLSYLYFERIIFGKIQTRFWARNFLILIFTAGMSVLSTIIFEGKFNSPWVELIIMFASGGTLYLFLLWLLGFLHKEEKARILTILKLN